MNNYEIYCSLILSILTILAIVMFVDLLRSKYDTIINRIKRLEDKLRDER